MPAHSNTTARSVGLPGDRGSRDASVEPIFAGVDVGGTRIKLGLADRPGRLLSCRVLKTHDCGDSESFLKTVTDEITSQASAARSRQLASAARVESTSHRAQWFGSRQSSNFSRACRWPHVSATGSDAPSCVTMMSTLFWPARCALVQAGH